MNLYEALRNDILIGAFEPGSKLKMGALRERYHSGISVIRESLTRLASEGLVDSEDQKGFRVASIAADRLSDLTRLRILLECDGATHSLERGGIDWESNLVAAHHKLAYIEEKMREDEKKHFSIWNQCDYEFHAALIAACGSQLHMRYHKQVYDQFRQYVLVELKTNGFRGTNIIDEHEAILRAALARDAGACCEALKAHLVVYLERSTTN